MFHQRTEQTVEPLRLTVRQAAKVLSVSEKTLFNHTKSGEIPAVRIGRAVRYSLEDLKQWIQQASERNCEKQEDNTLHGAH